MKSLAVLVCLHLSIAAGQFASVAASQGQPSLEILLERAGHYLTGYERQMSMVVAEEQYTQISAGGDQSGPGRRLLKSDILVVDLGRAGWFAFRDVLEVDGRPVRDRENRLLALVTSPSPDVLGQARRMAEESARFNIGRIVRTINTPTLSLAFLRRAEQRRSDWTFGGRKKIEGFEVTELRFQERDMPRAIETRDNAAAKGRFWIEADSGRVVRSELIIDSAGITAMVTVTFGPVPGITPWVPLSMADEYRPRTRSSVSSSADQLVSRDDFQAFDSSARIDGHATYRNFRTFTVDTNTVIKR